MILGSFNVQLRLVLAIFAVTALAALRPAGAGRYFNLVQPLESHTNVPPTGINVYSFALAPEEHQPSGTCNFSKIEDAKLILTLTHSRASQARVYAVNYNVLRIMSGMSGLAYST